jgi:hypothetical protein
MNAFSGFIRQNDGIISFELAAYSLLFLTFVWFSAEAVGHNRNYNDVSYSAGALAEILVNQTVPTDTTLPKLIEEQVNNGVPLKAFTDMLGFYSADATQAGLSVAYLNSADPDGTGALYSSGDYKGCAEHDSAIGDALDHLKTHAKSMEDDGSVIFDEYVMVVVCTKNKPKAKLLDILNLLFNDNFYSKFIASKKS